MNIKCGDYHKQKRCKCKDHRKMYFVIDNDISMQFNQDKNQINKETKIFKLKDDIYLKIEKNNDDNKWKMSDKIYTKQEVENKHDLEDNQIPDEIRNSPLFKQQLNQEELIQRYLSEEENVQTLIETTNWCHEVPVFWKKNNVRRKKKIHHVIIVKNDDKMDIAITFIYDKERKTAKTTAIHTDKELLCRQHQWISLEHMNECRCFENFHSSYNYLSIGNPDDPQNLIKHQQNTIELLIEDQYELKQHVESLQNRLRLGDGLSSSSSLSELSSDYNKCGPFEEFPSKVCDH